MIINHRRILLSRDSLAESGVRESYGTTSIVDDFVEDFSDSIVNECSVCVIVMRGIIYKDDRMITGKTIGMGIILLILYV